MSEPKKIDPAMAAKIAAIKARMAGGPSAPAAAAAEQTKPAATAAGALPEGSGGDGGDMAARIAALKAKRDAGRGAPAPAPTRAASRAAAAGKAGARGTGRQVWPVKPVDRTSFGDERLYGPTILNKWFLGSSLALLLTCVWMWDRDWSRDWKGWQRQHREIRIAQLEAELEGAAGRIDAAALQQAEGDLEQARQAIARRRATLDELLAAHGRLEKVSFRTNQDHQFAKSEFEALRYEFEQLCIRTDDDPAAIADSREELEAAQADLDEKLLLSEGAQGELDAQKRRLDDLRASETAFQKRIVALTEERDRVATSLARIDHGIFNDYIRNAPLADMLAPTLKIDQIVLDKLRDNYNFMYVGKIDRCTTCHLGIDDPSLANWDTDGSKGELGQRVLNAHPRLDLFVAEDSPHPKEEFGCTVCHMGRGQAVEFPRTFHVPGPSASETVAQKQARWVRDFGYEPDRHYWDWPMVRADYLHSACYQCHQETDRIDGVPGYNQPRALVEELGCYGCHQIDGFEHLRKRGPDLTNLASKTDEAWTRRWLMDPRGFRPDTRMPHFWNQSNSGALPGETDQPDRGWNNNRDDFVQDWRARNAVEARSVVAYLFGQSRERLKGGSVTPRAAPAGDGDTQAGRQLFADRGCLGCHSVQREGWTANDHGPDLGAIGSKVTAHWLYNWILDPTRYFPDTVMPDLRLTEAEAWDITAWLLTLTDPAWEARPEPAGDRAILQSIAVEQLSGVMSQQQARVEAERMLSEDGEAALERYVGDRMLARYGCAGCHLVPDHYDDKPIGTEQTREALKELSRLDFGFEASHSNPEAIPHTKVAWFEAKLRDPRVFDRIPIAREDEDGVRRVVRYDMKVKSPGDKLHMPNFGLTDDEVHQLVTFVLGLRADGIDETVRRRLTPDERVIEQASRIMTARNCTGCHRLGQLSQPVALDEDTLEEGFEHGLWAAAPVVADGREVIPLHGWISDEVYDPWEEEDVDTADLLEQHPLEGTVLAYGRGEGGLGSYVEEAAMRPPVLRGEGAKVHPDWLFDFLLQPYVVRTHLKARMPSFGFSEDEARALARWFALRDDQPWPFARDAQAQPDPALLAEGAEQFGFFQCNSCHPSGSTQPANPDPANWGPDLGLAAARLKMDWVAGWLTNPQTLQPGTKMPNFFGEYGDGEYTAYYEDWEQRVAAVTQYLRHMERVGEGGGGSR